MSALPQYLFLLTLACGRVARAAYNPAIDFNQPSMPNLRTNFCDLPDKLRTGELHLVNALRGYNISALVRFDTRIWFHESETGEMTGLQAELMELVSKKGGFTWSVTSTPVSSSHGMSITDFLDVSLNYFDVVVTVNMCTEERAVRGIQSPFPFCDMSVIALQYHRHSEESGWDVLGLRPSSFFRFTRPLSPGLWFGFLVVSLATSAIYLVVEKIDPKGRHHPRLHAMYQGLTTFTGAGSFDPVTRGGKLMSLSFSFVVLVLVSSYTANLAVVLVTQELNEPCSTLAECVIPGTRDKVCVLPGSAEEEC
jgi:hypothetical protein